MIELSNVFLEKEDAALIRGSLLQLQINLLRLQDEVKSEKAIAKYEADYDRCEKIIQYLRKVDV